MAVADSNSWLARSEWCDNGLGVIREVYSSVVQTYGSSEFGEKRSRSQRLCGSGAVKSVGTN